MTAAACFAAQLVHFLVACQLDMSGTGLCIHFAPEHEAVSCLLRKLPSTFFLIPDSWNPLLHTSDTV